MGKQKAAFLIPSGIEPEAVSYMNYVLEQLRSNDSLTNADSAALTMLARNYSMFIKAEKQLEEEGLTVRSDRGNIAEHPAVKIARDAQASALKIMKEFGLTTKSRQQLGEPTDKEEDSPLEEFFKK